MRLDDLQESKNVEDRRSAGGIRGGMMGGIGGLGRMMALLPLLRPLLRSKFGWVIIVVGALLFFGVGGGEQKATPKSRTMEDKEAAFISKVLKSTENVWNRLLPKYGMQYQEPKLVLFRGSAMSGCGYASAQVGPFYCPVDRKIYIDLAFFDELERRFGAEGDFARAYVLAHEVGHHIQNQLGILDKVHRLQQRALQHGDRRKANRLQVPLELQADCLAGVWAHYVQKRLEPGDIQEGVNAAAAVGDDMIQKKTQGYVVPDSFTHGSSKERASWFLRGFRGGDLRMCNTFGG